jgi:hypothetical protein
MKKLSILCAALLSAWIISAKDVPKASIQLKHTLIGTNIKFCNGGKRKGAMQFIRELKKKASVRIGTTRLYFGPAGQGAGLTLKF